MAATSRTITYDIIANDKTATGLNKAAAASEHTAGRFRKAFGSALGTLNSTGALGPFGDALQQVQDRLTGVGDKATSVGGKMLKLGATGVGVGGLLTAAAQPDIQAHQQLAQAIENTGGSLEDYGKQIDQTISHETKFGDTAGETQNALQTLVQGTGSTTKALGLMGEASDLAAAKHESLTAAADQLVKIAAGKGTKTLVGFGITTADVGKGADKGTRALGLLSDKIKGQANAAADTFGGHLKAIQATIENQAATLGQKYGPALMGVSAGMTILGPAVEGGAAMFGKLKGALGGAQAAQEAMTAAELEGDAAASANPIGLIVIAVVALGVAIYELVTHWKTVWKVIQSVAETVFNDVLKPLFNLFIATQIKPLIFAFHLMREAWSVVWNAVTGVIRNAWNNVILPTFNAIKNNALNPIIAQIRLVRSIWSGAWQFMGAAVSGASRIITNVWNGIQSVIKGGLNTVIGAINFFIDMLDSIQIHIPSIGVGPFHTPGFDWNGLGIPEIPSLATGGVVWPQPGGTLVRLAEAGMPETVTPGLGSHGGNTYQVNVNVGVGDPAAIGKAVVGYITAFHTRGGQMPSFLASP